MSINYYITAIALSISTISYAEEPKPENITIACGSRAIALNTIRRAEELPIMMGKSESGFGEKSIIAINPKTGSYSVFIVVSDDKVCMLDYGTIIKPPEAEKSSPEKEKKFKI